MNNELSTKTRVLKLVGGDKFFLTPQESEQVVQALRDEAKWLQIGESVIFTHSIACIVGTSDYEETEHEKHGDYKCKYGYWHTKHDQCGHGLI